MAKRSKQPEVPASLRANFIAAYQEAAIEAPVVLAEIMLKAPSAADRATAAKLLMEYGHGKPLASVAIAGLRPRRGGLPAQQRGARREGPGEFGEGLGRADQRP
jgi:hypothetical protein